MIRNYLKIAWRNLVKNRASAFINISGLAVGMAVAMLIGLWVWDELSFNKYHKNYDRIARVVQKEKFLGGIRVWDHLPYQLANLLKTDYKRNFKEVITAIPANGYSLSIGDQKITKEGVFIDDNAPEVFTLKMLEGSWTSLKEQHSVILSASYAKALFGDADPINKVVNLFNSWSGGTGIDVKVTGIYEDLPANTQFHEIQFMAPWDLYLSNNAWIRDSKWDDHRLDVYAELQPGISFDVATSNIKDAEMRVIRGMDNMKQEVAAGPQILLNPMSRWHLYSDFKEGVADNGPVQFVWLVGIIGSFVLLLACINFMNLSTARSEKRAKEVGIRKAIGSARVQLIIQFFGESFLTVVLAFAVAIFLVAVSLNSFNDLAAKQIVIPWTNIAFWICSIAFILATSLLAGAYPAIYLSSFKPVKVLKGTFRVGRFAATPRKILVVVQMTFSVILIIGTIIVYRQVIFVKNRPVGYSRDGLITIPIKSPEYFAKYEVLRTELIESSAVTDVAESESALTNVSSNNGGFNWKGKDPNLDENFGTLTVSDSYGKTIGWQFLEGRDFSKAYASDSSGFVINEAAAKFMGLKHPLGETLHWDNKWMNIHQDFKIIGVIKDMVMESPYEPVKPTIFRLGGNPNWIYIRINPNMNVSDALAKIGPVFKKLIATVPFEYNFADQDYAKKFATEVRIGKLAFLFAAFAIFISCLGLFGMASFMAEQRIKEIGVRKVLGATVLNLWGLLSKDFVQLVTIALLIAVPTAYYFMHSWLQHYTYRADISWWIFIIAAAGAIMITLLTVSYQSVKAAMANPVKSLRSE